MKIAGYFFIITAVLNLIVGIASLSDPSTAQYGARQIGGVFMFGILGMYLLHRASAKEKEKQDRDKWMNGNSQ